MDWPDFYEHEVFPRLSSADVFAPKHHDWTRQGRDKWRGTCPFCDSENGRIFVVDPRDLAWYCYKGQRGGGPAEYIHAHNHGTGTPKGEDFIDVVKELAEAANVEVPEEENQTEGGRKKSSDRRPLRNPPKRQARPETAKATTGAPAGGEHAPRNVPPRGQKPERKMKHGERRLRQALVEYREALKTSDRARAYVQGRGLSVETLHAYGGGYAAPGEWIDDPLTNEDGKHVHRAPNGRIVTPHTTPGGRLVCLSGRAVPPCPDWKRKRHLTGHTPALFNASAIGGESFDSGAPLVLCEGPFDALSFIEAGWERTVALHNTDGVPWRALRGNAETLVFAFDRDDTGREDAVARAIEARRRGFGAHVLHDEAAYEGHSDPNEALQAGELSLDYLHGLKGEEREPGADSPTTGADSKNNPHARAAADSEKQSHATGADGSENNPMTDGETAGTAERENKSHDRPAEPRETAAKSSGPEAGRSPTSQNAGREAAGDEPTAADLIPYWNGSDIGHLGRWLWERGGVPDGDVGAGLYADRELCKWIKAQLEAGPQATSEETQVRLRWVLWRLYAAHGPEEVPERQIPVPPMRRA